MHISLDSALGRQRRLNSVGESVFQIAPDAAAGYSLRSLTGGDPSVVRVRRESDNGERDFNASAVSSGELVNWVNQQITPPLDLRTLTATGRDGPIIEAAAAYSLRNLSDSYTGSVVDVRRSSDGEPRSFTAAEVTDGTLVAWVGAGNDGTVSKWYDQSTTSGTPNAKHAVQTDAAKQPKIVSGGSLVTGGLDFDGTNDFFETSLVPPNVATLIGVANWDTTGAFMPIIGARDSTDKRSYLGKVSSGPAGLGVANSARLGNDNIVDGDDYLLFGTYSGLTRLLSTNGSVVSDSSGATPNNTTQGYAIGAFNDGGTINSNLNGTIQEVIVYNTDQSDNRTALEANIGEVYGIAGIPAYDNTVNGFVETWYDQSGNGNNATQLTAGSQPKIVNAGSLVTGGLDFDGVNDHFTCPSLYSANLSVFTKLTTDSTNADNFMRPLHICDGSDSFQITRGGNSDVGDLMSKNTSFQASTAAFNHGSISGNSLITSITSGSATQSYANGSVRSNTDDILGDGGNATTTIGARSDLLSSSFFNNAIQEVIIYPSDQSDNRLAIEANINNQYDI